MKRLVLLLAPPILLSAMAGTDTPVLRYPDFSSTRGLNLVESARREGKVLRLAPAHTDRRGAAWAIEKREVATGFETEFRFQLTHQGGLGHGADGIAFLLQNDGPSAIAGNGGAVGFAMGNGFGDPRVPGIPFSIAVFLDTYRNEDAGDPSNNYIAVCNNGSIPEMRWPPARLAYTRHLPVFLKDKRVHTMRVVYRPPVMSVFLDDLSNPVLTSPVDLAPVVDAQGKTYVGFTAATGAGYQDHDLLSWTFNAGPDVSSSISVVTSNISFFKAACLPDRALCTPEDASVEETGPRTFHIVLPANRE